MAGFVMTVLAIAGGALAVGALIGAIIIVPFLIYTFPYACWSGWNKGNPGFPKEFESHSLPPMQGIMFNVRNATKLYRSWITHEPHGITKF